MLIYIKLNVAQPLFKDERLGINMSEDGVPVAQFDYSNINAGVIEGLNSGVIVQITAAEYWSIFDGLVEEEPGDTTSGDGILNIKDYWVTCPPTGSVFILIHENKFYKIGWDTIKGCLAGGNILLTTRMGQFECPLNEGDTSYTNAAWIGKNARLLINGVKQYTYAEWALSTDPDLEANTDYTNWDTGTGTFTRPAGFKVPELLEFIEV